MPHDGSKRREDWGSPWVQADVYLLCILHRVSREHRRLLGLTLDSKLRCVIIIYTDQLARLPMSIPRRNATKIKTLRQQGVLNSHPEAVTDPLFQTADFFDPQDLLQVKYEMLRRVEIDKAAIDRKSVV